MVLDKNAYCPGGTNKKIKHCMCQDITGELDKILAALDGDQRVAALDRINRTLATKANRPCLLSLKISILLEMKDLQSLEDTVTTFVKVAPDNALAHTYAALLEARKHRMREAIDELQTAVSLVKDVIPGELSDGFLEVGVALADSGLYMAASAHLMAHVVLEGDNEEASHPFLSLLRADGVPLPFKQLLQFAPCPAGATWKMRFDAAQQDAVSLRWRKALEKFEKLNQDFPDQPAILQNIAQCRTSLGLPRTADAWRAYANCPGVEFQQAVDAETLGDMLGAGADVATIPFVQWTINIQDANALNEKLLSSKQFQLFKGDLTQFRTGDAPPPKSVFLVLDRPQPESDAEPTVDTVPHVLTHVAVFGRETDRAARIEMSIPKCEWMQQVRTALTQVGGELLTSDESEEIKDTVPRTQLMLNPLLLFPDSAPLPVRQRIHREAIQRNVQQQWADIPLASLNDKTPREVVGDPAYRIRLAAAVQMFEEVAETQRLVIDFRVLREQLGVAEPEPINSPTVRVQEIAPSQFARVVPESLNDNGLLMLLDRAILCRARKATARLSEEVLRRPSLAGRVDLAAVHVTLAELSQDTDEAIAHVQEAQKIAVANKKSPALHLLRELPFRFIRGESEAATALLQRIQTHHLREPGVSEGLYNILVQFGIIRPDGQPSVAPESPDTGEPTPAPSQLWTPDGPPPATDEKKPSQLWVPD
jgi:hypothetical protein